MSWGTLLYLVGEPGAGKTTVMTALTAGCERVPRSRPFGHELLVRGREPVGIELGRTRRDFSGTDALSMRVAPLAQAWIKRAPYPLVLGEGDRLASLRFFLAARDAGMEPAVIWIHPPDGVAADRRLIRSAGRPNQDPKWIAGRRTKAANLVGHSIDAGLTVHEETADADSPEQIAARIAAAVPALAVLGGPALTQGARS